MTAVPSVMETCNKKYIKFMHLSNTNFKMSTKD